MKRELLIVCLAFLFIALPLSCKIEEKPDVRFAVLADIQYDDADPRGTRYYRESMAKFEASVDSLEGYALDFLVQLGDLIDQNPDHFDRLLPIFNRLTCPIYHLVGNHDILVSFQKKETIYKLLGVERGYSDFVVKKWRFIRLDGNEISLRAV
ncbi:metallophosphoesterase [candidate division KSB1 bacterium]|nr:metallophosphoesterase [candidate division KSB1 bacterium]